MQEGADLDRIGPGPEGRVAFARYIAAFNRGDVDGFTAYYAPNVRMNLGVAVLEGRATIAAYYRTMYERVTERLEMGQIVMDADGIAVEISVTFSAHEDAPDFPVAPIPKGHRIWGGIMVMYALREGKMADIRIGWTGQVQGPVPF